MSLEIWFRFFLVINKYWDHKKPTQKLLFNFNLKLDNDMSGSFPLNTGAHNI